MSIYTRTNPFTATIKERKLLSKHGSKKSTHHIVLDLKGSNLSYQVGDSLGIYPLNSPELVEKSLQAMKASGLEKIQDKEGNIFRNLSI